MTRGCVAAPRLSSFRGFGKGPAAAYHPSNECPEGPVGSAYKRALCGEFARHFGVARSRKPRFFLLILAKIDLDDLDTTLSCVGTSAHQARTIEDA
jgi:hypothetical protein